MKFGIREICEVVLKKKTAGQFGKLYLDKDMPVLYFDTLKTSSLEGAATTVYAQGGRGNPRLVAWEGDRTVTFTMEDALISPESFSILSGAGLIDATSNHKIYVHTTQRVEVQNQEITLEKIPSTDGELYIMLLAEDGSISTNQLPMHIPSGSISKTMSLNTILKAWQVEYNSDARHQELYMAVDPESDTTTQFNYDLEDVKVVYDMPVIKNGDVVYVDYYVEADSGVKQIEIEAGKFGGSYYLEASTLWRDQASGQDYPAEFVIPNCKIQSNFTFTMASTGDPSTFTFTIDAFPDYTKFDKTKRVIAALQIVEDEDTFGQ